MRGPDESQTKPTGAISARSLSWAPEESGGLEWELPPWANRNAGDRRGRELMARYRPRLVLAGLRNITAERRRIILVHPPHWHVRKKLEL